MKKKKSVKKQNLIIISNDECNFRKDISLQGGFKTFRAVVNNKRKKTSSKKKEKKNPEQLKQLRQKFVDTAKTFIGIPYDKNYLKKNPDYNGIFLDCCGLVRHTVNLLKDDFGFSLDRWNQAYQYDILPDEIPFEQMQPGDLIFFSAKYYPDIAPKQQKHHITHVEIYLGEGEKTIGSREKHGYVDTFDSFQFLSDKYYNIKYHFKSIDTWLKGIHKSFCPLHKWHEEKPKLLEVDKVNKYSAFYEEFVEEEINIE